MGVSGRWVNWIESTEKDYMGWWSWINFGGNGGTLIKVISVYHVSQQYLKDAGVTTICQQQARSMIKRGVANPNPKTTCLTD